MGTDQHLDDLLARATALESKARDVVTSSELKGVLDELEGLRDEIVAIKSSEPAGPEGEGGADLGEERDDLDGWAGLDFEPEPEPDPAAAPGVDVETVEPDPVLDPDPVEAEVTEVSGDFDDLGDELVVVPPGEEGEKAWEWALEVKAWAKCSKCGSTDADEYDDDTARCADCGNPLVEADEDPDDEPREPASEGKSLLSTSELLRAERLSVARR